MNLPAGRMIFQRREQGRYSLMIMKPIRHYINTRITQTNPALMKEITRKNLYKH